MGSGSKNLSQEALLLVAEASSMGPVERDAFFKNACEDNPDLLEIVIQRLDNPDEEECEGETISMLDSEGSVAPSPADTTPSFNSNRPPHLEFGDYVLRNEIARGGMGVVYKAEQKSLKREVAVKMIRSSMLANEVDVERFHIEAEAAASLDHPNIVPIYEIGEWEGQCFFSMKLIKGTTLRDRVSEYRINRKAGVRLMVKVARAVFAAHQCGILHRDLKPENILVDESGEPYVTDFGLAKNIKNESGLTIEGQILGTPNYMAPEQAEEGRTVTTSTDIYGLGAILYELLTNQPPFRSTSLLETMRLVVHKEPEAPRKIDTEIDRDLETISLKCLEKNPGSRYETAAALAEDLERWLRSEPVIARPIGRTEKLKKWIRRRPTLAALYSLVLIFILGLAVGGPAVALHQAKLKGIADERSDTIQKHLYFSEMTLATGIMGERNDLDQIQKATDRWALENTEGDFRGWEWWFLKGLSIPKVHEHLYGDTVTGLALNPDETQVAIASGGQVEIRTPDFKTLIHSIPFRASFVNWRPDGLRLALTKQSGITRFWDTKSQSLLPASLNHDPILSGSGWSPDGRLFFHSSYRGSIRIWEVSSEKEVARIEGVGNYPYVTWSSVENSLFYVDSKSLQVWEEATGKSRELSSDWRSGGLYQINCSPDGSMLATAAPRGNLNFTRLPDGKNLGNFPAHQSANIKRMAWSPDSTRVATGGEDNALILWDAHKREIIHTYHHRGAIHGIHWTTRDDLLAAFGNRVVSIDVNNPVDERILPAKLKWSTKRNTLSWSAAGLLLFADHEDLYTWQPGQSSPSRIFEAAGTILRAKISSDGMRAAIYSENEPITIIDLKNAGAIIAETGPLSWTDTLAWSPDQKKIASVHHNGYAHIWDAESGEELLSFNEEDSALTGITWSPDGTLVATQSVNGYHRVRDSKSGIEIASGKTPAHWARGIKWEPNGDRLASINLVGGVIFWTIEESKLIPRYIRAQEQGVSDLQWAPDGSRVATIGTNGEIRLIDSDTGFLTMRLKVGSDFDAEDVDIEWSPDGKTIVYGAGKQRVLRLLEAPDWMPGQ